jgi:hypothetical protein
MEIEGDLKVAKWQSGKVGLAMQSAFPAFPERRRREETKGVELKI